MGEVREYLTIALCIPETEMLNIEAYMVTHEVFVFRRFLRLHVLKFYQSVYTCRSMDNLRQCVKHLQNRLLYLADKLQERSHHTEGDNA